MGAKGVVAAGHPLTAEAGAQVLRDGGNAVDAAICAVLTSFAVESPLTGFGAGGFMLVHDESGDALLDFFVAAPGLDGTKRRSELLPISVYFTPDSPQVFNVGAASCGVPGTAAGLAEAARRFGSMPIAELAGPGIRAAREGAPLNAQQAFILEILAPIHSEFEEARALYVPDGRVPKEGETFRFPELADALERFAADGPEPFYRGDVGRAISDWVVEHGGTLAMADLAVYEPVSREPAHAHFRGADVLTNPPPSAGGILIAYCLALLERAGECGPQALVRAMEQANDARGDDFHNGLHEDSYVDRFMADRLGSTTHLCALDAEGRCATVTCSNGSGSGVIVPGTGVHLNNMLGEHDLNPLGFHVTPPGRRISSMMAPTVVLRDGELLAGLGSAGSNRIRSAILQTIIRLVAEGMPAAEAVEAPRLHFEEGIVQAEPGIDETALLALEDDGYGVARWHEINLFFGGVQAVVRDPSTGAFGGGGDPRRGGAVVIAE
jgi:gamma-glutamyltranspeptidase/glutathione hydrolase